MSFSPLYLSSQILWNPKLDYGFQVNNTFAKTLFCDAMILKGITLTHYIGIAF